MFRKVLVGPFGTEFDFPTLEQVAAVLLPGCDTFYLTAHGIDGFVPVQTDEQGRVMGWDKAEQENLGLEFSPKSRVKDVCLDEYDGAYTFTLCEGCE